MQNPLIDTILFDMGWTLRRTVKDPQKQQQWLDKLIHMTALPWSTEEMAQTLTARAKEYKKWGEMSLVELRPEALWVKWLLPELPEAFVRENAAAFNHCWRKAIGEAELFPHAAEVIRVLFKRGYRLGIVSNTVSSEETPGILKTYGLDAYLEAVVLSCDFGKRKPDPAIFMAAVEQMGVDPASCAYVGDQMDRDIAGSKRAGFQIAVLIEHDPKTGAPRSGLAEKPDHIIHSLDALLDIFPPRFQTARLAANQKHRQNGRKTWNVTLSTKWSHERMIPLPDLAPILYDLELDGIELNHAVRSADLTGFDLGSLPIRSIHEPCPADVSTAVLARRDWQISATDAWNRRQGVRMMMRSIDLAHQLGARHVVVHPGNAGLPGLDEKELRRLYKAGERESSGYQAVHDAMIENRKAVQAERLSAAVISLRELLEYARPLHIRLGLENRFHVMDIPSPDEMETLLDLAEPEFLGVQFDVGHAQTLDALGFYPFMEWIDRFAHRIIGLHLHDVRGVDDHFAPGLGEVDYEKFAHRIPAAAYRTLEVSGFNSMQDITSGLHLFDKIGLIHRK